MTLITSRIRRATLPTVVHQCENCATCSSPAEVNVLAGSYALAVAVPAGADTYSIRLDCADWVPDSGSYADESAEPLLVIRCYCVYPHDSPPRAAVAPNVRCDNGTYVQANPGTVCFEGHYDAVLPSDEPGLRTWERSAPGNVSETADSTGFPYGLQVTDAQPTSAIVSLQSDHYDGVMLLLLKREPANRQWTVQSGEHLPNTGCHGLPHST